MRHLLIILVISCLIPEIAIAQQADELITQETLRARINERSTNPKFQKDSKLLLSQVDDLILLVDSLDTEVMHLEKIIDNKDSAITAVKDSIAPIVWITSPTNSIFETPMPQRDLIPQPLLYHYDLITKTRNLYTQINKIKDMIQTCDNAYSGKPEAERNKAIATMIGPLIDEYYNDLSSLILSNLESLTSCQRKYITDNIKSPYNQYINTYF